jgi:sec-independent protein translocase protein TatA
MFDPSAPHIIILLVVVLLLFGSSRLPGAANALGKSMHIFKKSVQGQDADGQPFDKSSATATAQPPAPQPPALQPYDGVNQQQLADLQRQVADLQRQNSGVQDSVPNSQQPF